METEVATAEPRVDSYFHRKLFLVTGGTGFLGLWLIPSVVTLSHLFTYLTSCCRLVHMFEFWQGVCQAKVSISGVEYLTKPTQAVNQATKGVDGIFHLAGVVIHSR